MGAEIAAAMGAVLVTALALLPITNPPGNAPIFLSLTQGLTDSERELIARKVGMNCAAMMVGAFLVGSHILDFFGISLPVVRVAGGMLVVATAWGMIRAEPDERRQDPPVKVKASDVAGRAFYPLSFPLTVGPGTIATAITLGTAISVRGVKEVVKVGASIVGIVLVALAIYFAYRYASILVRRLGPNGTAVFLRLSAFILLCIGVQIVWDGASELLAPWK